MVLSDLENVELVVDENFLDYFDNKQGEFSAFCWDVILQVWPNIWTCLISCLTWRAFRSFFNYYVSRSENPSILTHNYDLLLHILSIILGVLVQLHFFGHLYLHLCAVIFAIGLVLFLPNVRSRSAKTFETRDSVPMTWTLHMVIVTASCLAIVVLFEFSMLLREWHMIRGTVMIIVMKAISVAAPRSRECLKLGRSNFLRGYLTWCGYAFSPGSVVFGPWFSVESYVRATHFSNHSFEDIWGHDLARASISIVISVCCLLYSTYLSALIDISHFFSSRWTTAYVQSQSFRFSHYFVSFFSQSLHQVIGLSALTHPNLKGEYVSAFITNPISVELPRSLVDVVIHWNFPMHSWLKTFIYKPTRRFGQLPALLLTYAFSSLLHGLNFQLAAVLFSIGYYAYIDYILRNKLSKVFNACIEARACQRTCPHLYKSNDWRVRLVNVFFSGLAIFHLAYLAVMFDTSDQQDEGYTMHHALKKWSDLNFLSHFVAALAYLLYRLL